MREEFVQLRVENWLKGIIKINPLYKSESDTYWLFDLDEDDSDYENIFLNLIFLFVNPDIAITRKVYHQIPIEITESLRVFRTDHPSPRASAFIMMRFDDGEQEKGILKTVQQTLKSSGIKGMRADDKHYHDDVYWNIMTYIYGCGFGIAIYDRIKSNIFNPNVALEVGYMLALDKPVCLLVDQTLNNLQTDIIGKIYKPFDTYNPSKSIPPVLHKWLEDKGANNVSTQAQ